MAFDFTIAQQKVLQARNHDILVSAAAGSGKTAVLVERIVRMISEGEHPLDIDKLLVVTFTKAAAAQMRERIAAAISDRLLSDPGNKHLQRQETLLHKAQIMTMDSFFTFLLHNYFSDIDLDPGFRQMDQTEADLMEQDVLEEFLEEKFALNDPAFIRCVEYFCPVSDRGEMEKLIEKLHGQAMSHPFPELYLAERRHDYELEHEDELFEKEWFREQIDGDWNRILSEISVYEEIVRICRLPDGPSPYLDTMEEELEVFLGAAEDSRRIRSDREASVRDKYRQLYAKLIDCCEYSFARMPACTAKKYPEVDPDLKSRAADMRNAVKDRLKKLSGNYSPSDPAQIAALMKCAAEPVGTLLDLAGEFAERFAQEKKKKNVIDFVDLEHYALHILIERREDGTIVPRNAALACRAYYREIMIDEYQDSNDIQELILRSISGEESGHYNRFMVGDVKQSIYKFRMARPEIFMEKYGTYRPEDAEKERIDLDQNFRSRKEVLDSVNEIFGRIMRREVGGIEYDDLVSLKPGAGYEETGVSCRSELLLVNGTVSDAADAGEGSEQELGKKKQEALAVAKRIREMVGHYPVQDSANGGTRPARYGDIVILLRSGTGWNEEFREVFEKAGIPCHVETKKGYFSASEIRMILQLLRVLDNPMQEIPFYGVLHGYFGRFTEDEIAKIKTEFPEEDLYTAFCSFANIAGQREENAQLTPVTLRLSEKCALLKAQIDEWRKKAVYLSTYELLEMITESTGFENYCSALPGGVQRRANLRMFLSQAAAFEKTDLTGLFQFIRYIDRMHKREIDQGEANILDEHADVVRIMTIHKSKGLEFPICFVSGLAKQHAYAMDISGNLICDSEKGIGVYYMNSVTRQKAPTLRRACVAKAIARSSLGEELRVLYVAMTRAKEKLILTGYLRDAEKQTEAWKQRIHGLESYAADPMKKLPASEIEDSANFLELIYKALFVSGAKHTDIVISDITDLEMGRLEEQAGLGIRKEKLFNISEEDILSEVTERIDRQLSFRYPYENRKNLITKTTVSELKHAHILAMNAELREEEDLPLPEKESAAEEPVPIIPRFAMEEKTPAAKEDKAESYSGAVHGSCVHRVLELFDTEIFERPSAVTEKSLYAWVMRRFETGEMLPEYRKYIHTAEYLPFLRSSLAQRMARAYMQGGLHREQPFVMSVPALEISADYPEDEIILVQGIIDCFFMEDGEIVLVDYKTDRVRDERELIDRYSLQMNYYSRSISKTYGTNVKEIILYSFYLQKEVKIV